MNAKTLTKPEPLTRPLVTCAADLREGDLLILAEPMRATAPLVPRSFPTLTQLEVIRVLPGGGNDGEDVIHVAVWDAQVWSFEKFNERLARGLFRVERPGV